MATEPTRANDAYTAGCPKCGATDLLRLSEETAVYTQPVKALRWWGPGRVRVEAEGEKDYINERFRTVGIRCSSCNFQGDPALFAKEIVAAEVRRGS